MEPWIDERMEEHHGQAVISNRYRLRAEPAEQTDFVVQNKQLGPGWQKTCLSTTAACGQRVRNAVRAVVLVIAVLGGGPPQGSRA